MALPTIRSSSAPPSHNQPLSSNLGGKGNEARNFAISILKDTDWPKEVANDVQALINTIEMLPDLEKISKDESQIPAEVKVSIKLLLKELESVRTRLEGESKKYGTKKKGFRKDLKKLFSRTDPSECSQVLKGCRNDVAESSATVNSLLSAPRTENGEVSSQVAEGPTRDTSGGVPGTLLPPAAPTLTPNALLPVMNPVESNNPPFGSAPTPGVSQLANPSKQIGSWRGELLNGANKALKLAEGLSGALPVVGSYVGAVAKVGLTVVEMVQVMDDNDETAKRLGTHVCRLSNVLERFSNQPRQPETGQTANGMEDLQQALRDVRHEIAEQQSQPGMKKFWNSSDQSGSLKNLQDRVRAALEEIQLLLNMKTSILVEELHNDNIQNKYHRLLDRLGDGKYGARGEIIEDITCLPGTRVEILERIDNWIRGGPKSERVLWIRGMAGRGKSTIASTVAPSRRAPAAGFPLRRCWDFDFLMGSYERWSKVITLHRACGPVTRVRIPDTVPEWDCSFPNV